MKKENKFKFKTNDLEISFSGEKTFVEKQISEWKLFLQSKGENDVPNVKKENLPEDEENNNSLVSSKQKKISVKKNINFKDFIVLKKPENDLDKVLIAGYFLEKYEKIPTFNLLDLQKIIQMGDLEKNLSLNEKRGFIDIIEKDKKKSYSLSFSGEKFVRNGLEW